MKIEYEIMQALKDYEPLGRMDKDRTGVAWQWDDLFGPDSDDVWKLEVGVVFGAEMIQMARDRNSQNGLMLAVETYEPDSFEMQESPWWWWWSAEEAHRLYEEHPNPGGVMLHKGRDEAEAMRKWFQSWPNHEGLVLHIQREVPRKTPIFWHAPNTN